MEYVKLVSKSDAWFKEGTESYDYECDENNKYRITLDQWNKATADDQFICCRGTRICENPKSENRILGEIYFDGECCMVDEFIVEIVDEIV